MQPSGDAARLLIDHAQHCWAAEEENARRLSTKLNFGLTQIALLLAVLVFRIDLVSESAPQSAAAWTWIPFILVLAVFSCLGGALHALLVSVSMREGKLVFASERLLIRAGGGLGLSARDLEGQVIAILEQLQVATLRLQKLNRDAAARIHSGHRWLSAAFLLVMVILAVSRAAQMLLPHRGAV